MRKFLLTIGHTNYISISHLFSLRLNKLLQLDNLTKLSSWSNSSSLTALISNLESWCIFDRESHNCAQWPLLISQILRVLSWDKFPSFATNTSLALKPSKVCNSFKFHRPLNGSIASQQLKMLCVASSNRHAARYRNFFSFENPRGKFRNWVH